MYRPFISSFSALFLLACAAGQDNDPSKDDAGASDAGASDPGSGEGAGTAFGEGGTDVEGLPSDCGYTSIPTYREPGALLIVFDQSSSMSEDADGDTPDDFNAFDPETEKWKVTTEALGALLPGLPQDALVGLLAFPNTSNDDWCQPLPQATIPIGALSSTGPAISSLLSPSASPSGTVTPLAQALTAGHQYLSSVDVPGARAVLLVTDGAPSALCGQAGDETAQIAASWAQQGQLTYVIGLAGSAPTLLSKTAFNGGGASDPACNPNCCSDLFCNDLDTCCHHIAEGDTSQADLAAALDTIAGAFLESCVFDVPKGDEFDPSQVNVVVTIGDGEPELVPQGEGGWHYLGGDTDQVVIDEPLCSQILDASSEVEILLGCPTVIQ